MYWESKSAATENTASVKKLLTALRDQALRTDSSICSSSTAQSVAGGHRGSVRFESAGTVLPESQMRNVLDELPREQQAQTPNLMRAAWKLTDAEEGMKRLEGLA